MVLETLRQLLSQSPAPLMRQEALARWPKGEPSRADSVWRSLTGLAQLRLQILVQVAVIVM